MSIAHRLPVESAGSPVEEEIAGQVQPTADGVDPELQPQRSGNPPRPWTVRLGIGIGIPALWGALAGWWTPRGPLTTAEALWSLGLSLAIGIAVGLAVRSRWSLLVTPVAFAAVLELVRIGISGPTVDAIATSTYGLLAFVVGRGFHALVALVPLLFGAALGTGIARRVGATRSHRSRWRYAAPTVAVIAALALVAFVLALARPARTAPIVDATGDQVPGSIAELSTIGVGEHDLRVMIRGADVDNPVLLFLAGGPGGSELGAMRNHLPALETHFTVATWDQRGTGRSYDQLDPTDTYTLDSAVDDTIAVTDHLRNRFEQDRIYLLGQSWGSTLGILAVQEDPEIYAAFVGTGQMVSQLATDALFYQDTLAWAQAEGNAELVAELDQIGPPPYDRMLSYETALLHGNDVYPYNHAGNSEGEGGFSENFFVEEYAVIDQVHLLGAFMDTFSVLYPQLQEIDFRETATDFDVPMFFVQGAHEADGRAEVFDEWYPMVDAPIKDMTVLATSGHRPLFEQPEQFISYMVDTVLEETADQ